DAVAAVANRLALAVGGLAVVLALAWAAVLYTYRWFARHADSLLARALRWTRMHPRLGRSAAALIDPNPPVPASLLIPAACALDAHASTAGPLRGGDDRSQPARVGLAADPGRLPAGDRRGVVRAAGHGADAQRAAGAGPGRPRGDAAAAQPARRPADGRACVD